MSIAEYNTAVQLVALFTRAWIEIICGRSTPHLTEVALFTRAWIEMWLHENDNALLGESPSSRGRGLKYSFTIFIPATCSVALFTRAWIEIELLQMEYDTKQGRPLHEGVD